MAKSSGGTRASASNAPRGLAESGWTISQGNLGGLEATARGEKAAEIYYAIQSPVERAVESNIGDIRSGGGFSGPMDNREYTLIFRDGTTNEQIQAYFKGMSEGAKLYAKMNDRNLSDSEYMEAEAAFDKWYNKTNKAR